jgi:adenine phosphoribosyltransferase
MKDWNKYLKSSNIESFEVGNIWSVNSYLFEIIDDMKFLIDDLDFSCILGIESKGIIYGSALSYALKKPFVLIRKNGRINNKIENKNIEFINWKNEIDGLEIECSDIDCTKKYLVVDDLAYKLSTFNATKKLLEKCCMEISGFLCFANISGISMIDGKKIYSLVNK